MPKKGLLERLDAGEVVIGDGGYVFALEKRGYVKAGPWTPECVVEHPEAVRQLHREFMRAGSDVLQALTFYASEDKLENRGNYAGKKYTCAMLNEEACKLVHEVVKEGGKQDEVLVTASVSQTPSYLSGEGKAKVQEVFKVQIDAFIKAKVDFIICEYFEHVEEAVWATEVAVKTGLPVVVTPCIGPDGDLHGVSAAECAVRLAKAGANVVGTNCHFDPFVTLKTMLEMKKGLQAAGLFADPKEAGSKKGKAHLIAQPLGYMTPDAGKQGFIDLPEFPFGLEPRICTRWDYQRYAREAYDLGVRFIGACCGTEPFHIRGVAEELATERGRLPDGSEKHGAWGSGLAMHTKPWVRARARRAYWEKLEPASGRPYSSAFSEPSNWGVTAGSELLKQQKEQTASAEVEKLAKKLEKECETQATHKHTCATHAAHHEK